MKLTTLFLLIGLMQVSASVYSQSTKLTLKMRNKRVVEVLEEIEKQSEFRFAYSSELIDLERKVSVELSERNIEETLNVIFDGTGVKYAVHDRHIMLYPKEMDSYSEFVSNQQKSITGKVTDEQGLPLPGVSIVIKGTTTGTVSDADGNYSISSVQEESVMVFSFIGMVTQEIVAGTQTTINITMQVDAIGLEEVIAIGYGTRTRKEITGSVAQTTGEELKINPATNLSGSLAGRMTGVIVNQRNGEPGRDDATILIRGISSIGNNSPLYVIDGVADRDGISRLDPEDIETITVLKDASAAIYGARAAGGVILVTTKRGKTGKPTISYNFNQGFVQPTRLPDMADAGTFAQGLRLSELNNGVAEQDLTFSEDDVRKFRDGSSPLTHPNTDWFEDLFDSSSRQSRHNISLRGGNDKVKYFFSLGAVNQDGLFKEGKTKYKQYNFRANIDANVTENLKFGLDLAGRKEDRQWPGYSQWWVFWMAMRQSPTEMAVFPNGDYSMGIGGLNPLAMVKESGYQRLKRDVFNGTISFEYKIPQVQGLSVDGFAAVDNFSDFNKNYTTPWDYSTFDPATNSYETFQTPFQSNVSLRESFARSTSLTLNFKLKYTRDFGKHGVDAFVAYEQNTDEGDDFWASRTNFDTEIIDQLFAGSSDKQNHGNSGSGYETARQNYFGRASYNFSDKYLVDFNFRYDGSMNFPKDNRFGFFPGISIAWRASEESFFNIGFFDDLKLRASYGELGNDRIGSFKYLRKFSFGNNYVFGGKDVTGIQESGVSIPDVTWETTTVMNLGLDATFLDGKMHMEFDVFKNKTVDMLISRNLAIPSFAGFSPPPENAGEMENKGLELLLDYRDKIGNVGFNASGNISFAKNKVLFIDEVVNEEAPWQAQTGYKYGRSLLYDAIGIYRTQADLDMYPGLPGVKIGDLIYRDVDGNKEINGLDRIPIETTATPEIVFGINLGLTYKNFDLTTFFQGQGRATQPVGYRFDGSGNVLQKDLEDTWSSDNPNASYPRAGIRTNYYGFRPSTFWLQNASFVRLKSLEFGYTFPRSVIGKIGFEGLRAYVSGSNLFTISQIKDQDPEITSHEGTVHPQTKVFNIGIRVTL